MCWALHRSTWSLTASRMKSTSEIQRLPPRTIWCTSAHRSSGSETVNRCSGTFAVLGTER